MSFVLHITPYRNLGSIQTSGLLPKRGVRSRRACEKFDAIYCFKDKKALEAASLNWLWEEFSEQTRLVLLAVEVHPEIKDFSSTPWEAEFRTEIPAHCIQVLSLDVGQEVSFDFVHLAHDTERKSLILDS